MWKKKGKILTEEHLKHWNWVKSHACVPTVLIKDNIYRLYFSPRNEKNQSIPIFVDLDKETLDIINFGNQIIDLGEIGTFDDGGIMPCCVLNNDGKIFLYYVGWNPSISVPYRNSIGVCVSEDGGETFKRVHKGPIVDRNINEPFFTASPFVLKIDTIFYMWYASSTGFLNVNGKNEPLYHIKYASSEDGIIWDRPNISCINPNYDGECTARPSVYFENGLFKMYYTHRGSFDYRDGKDSYKLGYAESYDGKSWVRKDNDIKIEDKFFEWDSKMMTYPYYIKDNKNELIFYNGNGFGLT